MHSGGYVRYARLGALVVFELYMTPVYHQGTYDMSPAWATGLPGNVLGDKPCGIGLIDDAAGTCAFVVDGDGNLKCSRRATGIPANKSIVGFGAYMTGL